jgi:phosphoribosylformimino-5-aminoimidazole carboxamide ribonucleotide (ProFAR) isomerase
VVFEILPAIDVASGRLVSVSGGRARPVDAFGGSPVAAAEAFVRAGARWLHVVDVDRADGREPDLELATALARLGASIQASGGIASLRAAHAALGAGAARVVLSSSVLSSRTATSELVRALGARAVVGIEADGDRIRPRAAHAVELRLEEPLAWLRSIAPARYLYTALARVASMAGPDVDGVRAVAAAVGGPVLVAGGIRTLDDVRALRDLGSSIAEGCVVGRALYEGVDVRDVLALAGA